MRPLLRPGTSATPREPKSEEAEGADSQWRENLQNAWAALRMIRETIETLGPPGALISEDQVLAQYGPEPVHESHSDRRGAAQAAGPGSVRVIAQDSAFALFRSYLRPKRSARRRCTAGIRTASDGMSRHSIMKFKRGGPSHGAAAGAVWSAPA